MSTKIHQSKVPGIEYDYGEEAPLGEYDLEDIYKLNIDEAWYWYRSGSYEGSGHILMRKGDLWDMGDMSHCSCYGPTDRLGFNGKELSELKKSCSEGLMKEMELLFTQAENESN